MSINISRSFFAIKMRLNSLLDPIKQNFETFSFSFILFFNFYFSKKDMARDEKRNLIEQHEKYFFLLFSYFHVFNKLGHAGLPIEKIWIASSIRREVNACRILSHNNKIFFTTGSLSNQPYKSFKTRFSVFGCEYVFFYVYM